MYERKIIDRRLLADLAKEVGLNASYLEALGESRQWEIAVDGDMLERLVDIQHRFERLAAMGDDEYRGFYIEVPRPTPEEWGDVEELIAFGECDSREAFLADWLAFNPMETRWFHVASNRYVDSRSIRVTDRKRISFIPNRSLDTPGLFSVRKMRLSGILPASVRILLLATPRRSPLRLRLGEKHAA